MLYEIRESFDEPKKMYRQVIFVTIVMIPFLILGAVYNQPLFLFFEIPLFLMIRMVLFTKILDERHLVIQQRSNFFSFNLMLIIGFIGGTFLLVTNHSGEVLYTVGQWIIGFLSLQLFLNSLVEAYYKARMSEGENEE